MDGVTREEEEEEEGDERDAEKKTQNEGSSFSSLFPLIKISNMITADLATIIERLRVEFAKPRAPFLLQNPSLVLSFPFLSFPPRIASCPARFTVYRDKTGERSSETRRR